MGASSNTPSASAGNNQGQASTTLGVGGATSGQAGATPAHESQAETGGSGGAQLTHSHGEIPATPEAGHPASPAAEQAGAAADPADSALQTGARGAQDTRAGQGGGTGTGLGSPESGANQSASDLPPR